MFSKQNLAFELEKSESKSVPQILLYRALGITTTDSFFLASHLLIDNVMVICLATAYMKAKAHRIRKATRLSGHFSDIFCRNFVGYMKENESFC